MKSRNGLLVIATILFASLFFAFKTNSKEGIVTKEQKLLETVGQLLKEKHFSPKDINDAFSKQLFKDYLKEVDPDKNLFLLEDVTALKKYETSLDDEIKGAEVKFLPSLNPIYDKRLQEVMATIKSILSNPFDFSVNEKALLDADKLNFPATDAERTERWRQRLKYMTLERYVDLLEQREKTKDEVLAKKTDAQLEQEAREKTQKAMERLLDRLKVKFTAEERFNSFINSITSAMDPHTNYFPPIEKRAFDEQMTGVFYGIGAQLREEDGLVKIATLVTGSPAWKSGQIQVGDAIIKVAQGAAEAVDLSGFAVEDAVKLIRGNQGTEVRLTIKKADGSIKIVSLIREKIVQDEAYARSAVVQNGNVKVGYIYLPDFYADFERPDGARCSEDVAKEVEKLKAEKVSGIILDLRNNGGGSLYEVINMVGLFISDGPVVQVKDKEGKPSVYNSKSKAALYNGPLTVMVNEFSASASEIFAAAIQDYKRGIIIGSTSTYGKGTVQRNVPIGKQVDFFTGQTEYGAVKLTFQKFYRVNGGATQLKGVASDIVLPDTYEFLKLREKDQDNALPWDEIQKSPYQSWEGALDIPALKKIAEERIAKSTAFTIIKNNTAWLSKVSDKEYELNLDKYKQEVKLIRSTAKQNEVLQRLPKEKEMEVQVSAADKNKFYNNPDKAKGERYQQWLKNLKADLYVDEATKIINDIIALQNHTVNK